MRTLRACKEVFDRQAGDEGLAPGNVGVALKELGVTADDPAVAQLVELSLAEAAAEMGGRTASTLAYGAGTTAAAGMAGATEAEEQKEQGEEGEAAAAAALSYKEFIVLFRNVYAPANRFGADLRRAAGRGEVGAVRALLARGCNPNCRDGAGWTSLHHAAAYARDDVIALLKDVLGADLAVDAPDVNGWTPFMTAASNGNVETMRALKGLGADTSAVSGQGRNALHWAAAKGKDASLKFLLTEGGLNCNAVDEGGWTALHCAAVHGHASTAKLLCAGVGGKKTDLKIRDAVSATVRDYCEARGLGGAEPDPVMMSVLDGSEKKGKK